MKKIITALLFLALSLSLFGCNINFSTDSGDGGDDDPNTVKISADKVTEFPSYTVRADKAQSTPITQFSDGTYNYFIFKIGEVENTPIYCENATYNQGLVDLTYKWEESTTVEEKLASASSSCISNTVSSEIKSSISGTVSSNLGVSHGGVSAGVSSSIKAGLESKLGASSTETTSSSVTNTVSESLKNSKSLTYVIGKDCPIGHYRFIIYATCEIYAVIICDPKTETYNYTYLTYTKHDYTEGLFYSKNSSLAPEEDVKLEFDASLLSGIDIYGDNLPIIVTAEDYVYTNGSQRKVKDTGGWGLEQASVSDTLELSTLKEYMTDKFVFTFEIQINIEEVHDGYQEIFLYNQWNDNVSGSENISDNDYVEKTYGLAGYQVYAHGDGGAYTHTFTFTVDGARCREKMYLRYDAYGKYEDDWYINNLNVTVSVEPKK